MPHSTEAPHSRGAANRAPASRRRRPARALAGALACALVSAQLPAAPAGADDFSDFRIPKNRSLLWTAALSARAVSADQSGSGSDISFGNSNAIASTRFSWLSDSDPAVTAFNADLAAQGIRSHQDTESQFFTPTSGSLMVSERSDRDLRESWSLSGFHRRYPWAAPFGFEIALSAAGGYSQTWNTNSSDAILVNPGLTFQNTQVDNTETWRYLSLFSARASAGWGRVRNATGIYDALVLEQRLRETGALTRPLSREARQRLAEVLYMRGSFDTVRERPGRDLWREIERVLTEDGALAEGGLDPYSVLRAAEPHLGASGPLTADGVPVSPVARQTGGFAGIVVFDAHSKQIDRVDGNASFQSLQNGVVIASGSNPFSSRNEDIFDLVFGGVSGEYHRPLSPAWQLDAAGSAAAALRAEDNFLVSQATASLAWLAADRWTANAATSYQSLDEDRTKGGTPGDTWQWRLALGVRWYVEDRTAIEFSAAENQFWLMGDPSSLPHRFQRSLEASLGITYRFSGWFAAPGFFPMAALTPAR